MDEIRQGTYKIIRIANMGVDLLTSAGNWWLRTPNSNANNERNVNTTGAVNNNNANNANGVAVDYMKKRD